MSNETKVPKPRAILTILLLPDGNVAMQVTDGLTVYDLMAAAGVLQLEAQDAHARMKLRQAQQQAPRILPVLTALPLKPNGAA